LFMTPFSGSQLMIAFSRPKLGRLTFCVSTIGITNPITI
jgi:hypothetical protein